MMMKTRYSKPLLLRIRMRAVECIAIWSTLLLHVLAAGQTIEASHLGACDDFATSEPNKLAWTRDDCLDVWSQFNGTIPIGLQRRLQIVDSWGETGKELRSAGSPCLAASNPTSDGAGSSTLRHLASWIFAEELGCDWVTPDWGKRHVGGGNGTSVMYCHGTNTEREKAKGVLRPQAEKLRCSVVDWLEYFQFGLPSVDLPEEGKVKVIQTDRHSAENIETVALQLKNKGFVDQRWDRVMIAYDLSFASLSLGFVGNWDSARRDVVRKVLGEARNNFHVHPRPWYDGNPKCNYGPTTRLNFAIHVRMGDRRDFQDDDPVYFQLLEAFMDTVSEEVLGMGQEQPYFHVFSETLLPCPSAGTGLFDEFPTWPVELDQIPACLDAETPDDCPEKRFGQFCSPERSGIFRVQDRPIVFHTGHDVMNEMSCMIQADGILMGCSTFGQLAGVLTKGISFFSMHCIGEKTATHYKIIPPLAIAERGHLWVPVTGSWRDPVLTTTDLLSVALTTLLETRDG